MALLERTGARAPAPAPAPPAAFGAELDDDDLEQVVGGLERVYLPGHVVSADF